MTRDGYECYKTYLALQRHFSTSYDYFKYNGKVNASSDAYSKRNDMFAFEKLTKLIQKDEYIDFFVGHFLDNPKCWIRNMSKQGYDKYKAKLKNFPTKFKEDLDYLSMHKPSELMANNGDIPLIHKLCINKKVDIETLIAMDSFFPFIDKHFKEVQVPFVFPEHIQLLQKYRPFFAKHVTELHKDIMKEALLG